MCCGVRNCAPASRQRHGADMRARKLAVAAMACMTATLMLNEATC